MNAIVNATEPNAAHLQLSEETASCIKAPIAENTQKAYQHALQNLEIWLSGRTLSDTLLANYRKPSTYRSHRQHWQASVDQKETEDVSRWTD